MFNRFNLRDEDREQGFTLIELLVVIIIIGILAAIAIPVFLNQRKKGVDAGVKSDLKNAATALETLTTDGAWSAAANANVDSVATEFKKTGTNSITFGTASSSAIGYCLVGTNTGGSGTFYYSSQDGGLSTTSCVPATP